MQHRIAISITTIHVPTIVQAIEDNRIKFGHEPVLYIITGDQKTNDRNVEEYLQGIESRTDSTIVYLSLDSQNEFLTDIGAYSFKRAMPYNCIARRNVGDLYAYVNGAEIIIRVDDDNFPYGDSDFFSGHAYVGSQFRSIPEMYTSESGWYNICNHLKFDKSGTLKDIYPRGYPYEQRYEQTNIHCKYNTMGRIGINQGLWIGAPDLDAMSWLIDPSLNSLGFALSRSQHFALGTGTWSAINTQNTAIASYLLPVSFVSPYCQRYDDIFCGYIQRTAMDLIGDFIMYGKPLVDQQRNLHNTYKDLNMEIAGMEYCSEFCHVLRQFKGSVHPEMLTNCIDTPYLSLAFQINDYLADVLPNVNGKLWEWYEKSYELSQLWVSAIRTIDTSK